MENFKIVLLISAITLAACTKPMDRSYVIDGPRNAMFSQDLKGCKELADNYRPEARAKGAMIGATAGAVFGALDNQDDAAEGALVGAGVGSLAGAAAAQDELNLEKRNVVIRCLQNRGHKVIG